MEIILYLIIVLMRRLVCQSRTKITRYDHKSELERPPMTYVMGEDEMKRLNLEDEEA